MTMFTVKKAEKLTEKQTEYGPMQSISLALQEYGQDEVVAEWYTKATTPLPAVGSQLEGTVNPSPYGLKFKKAQAFNGRGGGRSPEDTKQIVRQHSQHMALMYAQIRQAQGVLTPEAFTMENLWKLVDAFDRDAAEGWKS